MRYLGNEKEGNELAAEWVAALRSGEYEQTKAVLYDPVDNMYCCLGVLCEVAGLEFNEDALEYTFIIDDTFPTGHELPIRNGSVVEEAWWEKKFPGILKSTIRELWERNDAGENFNTIADYISLQFGLETKKEESNESA